MAVLKDFCRRELRHDQLAALKGTCDRSLMRETHQSDNAAPNRTFGYPGFT